MKAVCLAGLETGQRYARLSDERSCGKLRG